MKKHLRNIFKVFFCSAAVLGLLYMNAQYDAYREIPLQYSGSMIEPFKESGVHITAKAYSSKDCQTYLDRDLVSKGYQPVQVTIQNNTGKTYLLSSRGVGMKLKSTSGVATHLSMGALPRSIGFKIAGFIFWPFIIPGAIDSIITFKSHLNLRRDFHAKSVKDAEEVIPPYSTVHRILFVSKQNYSASFDLWLKDWQSQYFHHFPVKIL